jgi:hypothetical protein
MLMHPSAKLWQISYATKVLLESIHENVQSRLKSGPQGRIWGCFQHLEIFLSLEFTQFARGLLWWLPV